MADNTYSSKTRKFAFATASLIQKRPTMADIKAANLARLLNSGLLNHFVVANNGAWNHEKWLDLCDEISRQDFTPIDYDQVGHLLEKKKAEYWEKLKH